MENTVAVCNVLVLHLAERPKQLPRSGTVAARHDLLLPLNMTATESDVSLGFSKVLQLNRAVHATPNGHDAEVGDSFQTESTKVNIGWVP
jgi:hypothetical protein